MIGWLIKIIVGLFIASSFIVCSRMAHATGGWQLHSYIAPPQTQGIHGIERFPNDPDTLLVNFGDGSIRRLDVCTQSFQTLFQRPGPDTYIPVMAISGQGTYVATNDPLSRVFVFSGFSPATLTSVRLEPDEGWHLIPQDVKFSPDESSMYLEYGGQVHEYSLPEFKPVRVYPSNAPNDAVLLHVTDQRISLLSQQRGLVQWTVGRAEDARIRDTLGEHRPLPLRAGRIDAEHVFYFSSNPHALNILNLNSAQITSSFTGALSYLISAHVSPESEDVFALAKTDLLIWAKSLPQVPKRFRLIQSNGAPGYANDLVLISEELMAIGFGNGEIMLLERNQAYARLCGERD